MTYEEFKQVGKTVVPVPYNEGACASAHDTPMFQCPYHPYSYQWFEWVDGWLDTTDLRVGGVFVYFY